MDMQPEISGLFPDATMEPPTMNELTLRVVEGELRILDVDLAQRLGFRRPTKIRDLIKRHMASLLMMGAIPTVGIAGQGEQAKEFYLNRRQAIFITAKSDTPDATDKTIEIIERFDAYDRRFRGLPSDQSGLTPDDRNVIGGIMKRVAASQMRPMAQTLEMLKRDVAALKAGPVATPVRRVAVGDFWPMTAIVRARGIGQKGRGRLVHQCTASMKMWCIKTARLDAVKIALDEEGKRRCVFEISAVDDWLADEGAAIIDAHKAKQEAP